MPDLPRTTMSNRSDAARHAPCTKPNVPAGISGSLWNPSARSTFGPSMTPPSSIACMPPRPSSAGWNTSFTAPAIRGASSFRTAATPSRVVVCTSWPQACIRPDFGAGKVEAGLLPRSAMHPCRHGSPSTGPGGRLDQSHHPGAAHPGLVADAQPSEFARHDASRANLLEAEFRMSVDVAPDFDQPWLDPPGCVADRGGGVVGETMGHCGGLIQVTERIMLGGGEPGASR